MGCAPDVPLQRLQAFLGLLYERHHDLAISLRYLPSASQLQGLRDGELDLGLIHDMAPPPGVDSEPLYRGEALAVVVSLAHRAATRETARHEDLAGDVLFVAPREAEPALHDHIVALAESDGFAFRDIREAPGPDVRDLLFAVASGRGVTIAPRSALNVAGDLGGAAAARSFSPLSWMPDTHLAWPVHARSELRDVYAAAHEVARELYRSY
jgi:DNA-binding transcriptional LysR family regulator